jgi:hypothetical protein
LEEPDERILDVVVDVHRADPVMEPGANLRRVPPHDDGSGPLIATRGSHRQELVRARGVDPERA